MAIMLILSIKFLPFNIARVLLRQTYDSYFINKELFFIFFPFGYQLLLAPDFQLNNSCLSKFKVFPVDT